MARAKGRNGSPTNLYLDDELKRAASKLAFIESKSLSELVEEELRKLIARRAKAAQRNAAVRAAA